MLMGRRLGPDRLVNGDFDAGSTGWTVTNADGTHVATFSGGGLRYQSDTLSPELIVSQSGIVIVGRLYEVRVVVRSWTSGACKVEYAGNPVLVINAATTYVVRMRVSNASFGISRASTNVDLTFESVSVREVL